MLLFCIDITYIVLVFDEYLLEDGTVKNVLYAQIVVQKNLEVLILIETVWHNGNMNIRRVIKILVFMFLHCVFHVQS